MSSAGPEQLLYRGVPPGNRGGLTSATAGVDICNSWGHQGSLSLGLVLLLTSDRDHENPLSQQSSISHLTQALSAQRSLSSSTMGFKTQAVALNLLLPLSVFGAVRENTGSKNQIPSNSLV